jgi:hypothetical protein
MSTSIEVIGSGGRADLSLDYLRRTAPAAFASHRFERTGDNYVFISTHELVAALIDAGFHPTDARQRRSRGERLGYARHMIRFRQASEDLRVVDCMPEIILINAHDATSAYQLRGGLYRFVCCNGLVLSLAEFGMIRVPHRGNVIASVVEGAQQISRHMVGIGQIVERMARTELDQQAQAAFAQRALELRFRGKAHFPFDAGRLLEARREADQGRDLWTVYNKVQENVICGGIAGRSSLGRRTTTRRITSIDEDIRINVALWQEAMALIRS